MVARTSDRQTAHVGLSIFRFTRREEFFDEAGGHVAELKRQKKSKLWNSRSGWSGGTIHTAENRSCSAW